MNYWIDVQRKEWGIIDEMESGTWLSHEGSLSSMMGCSVESEEEDHLESIDRMGVVVLEPDRFRAICRYLESMSVVLTYNDESWEFVLNRAQLRSKIRQMVRTGIDRTSKNRRSTFVRLAA